MIGCLQELQRRYHELNSQLLILREDPIKAIPALALVLNAQAVFWNWDVEPYSQIRDLAVIDSLTEKGIQTLEQNWDELLHSPREILSGAQTPYTVYTPFWKNLIGKTRSKPVATLENITGLTESELQIAQQAGVIPLPSAKT